MPKKKKTVPERRESTLSGLAGEYKDALHYTVELRRAIDGFKGPIPADSPYRYLRQNVGDSILAYLARVAPEPKSIEALVTELEDGGCIFGMIRSSKEIVTKAVKMLIQSGQLVWVDRKQTQVGLPEKKG